VAKALAQSRCNQQTRVREVERRQTASEGTEEDEEEAAKDREATRRVETGSHPSNFHSRNMGKVQAEKDVFFLGMKSTPRAGLFTDTGFVRRMAKIYFEEFEARSDEGMGTAEQRDDIQAMLVAPQAGNFHFNEITKKFHLKQVEKKMTFSTIDWKVLGNFLDGANLGVNSPKNSAGIKCFKNLKMCPSGAMAAAISQRWLELM
jgi:hypothetical protein